MLFEQMISPFTDSLRGEKTNPQNRRIIAVCNETKRKFLFGTEMEDEEGERRIIVRMVSYLALGGA